MSYIRIAAATLPGRICETTECPATATLRVEDYAARTFRPGVFQLLCAACVNVLIEDEVVLAKAIARAVRLAVAQRHAIGGAAASAVGAHIVETLQVVRDLTRDETAYERVVDRIHGAVADAVELAQMPPVPAWLLPQSETEAAEDMGASAAWHCTALDVRRC